MRGIFGAMPVETMHAFRKGVVENVTKLFLSKVQASKKAAFDNLAIDFSQISSANILKGISKDKLEQCGYESHKYQCK